MSRATRALRLKIRLLRLQIAPATVVPLLILCLQPKPHLQLAPNNLIEHDKHSWPCERLPRTRTVPREHHFAIRQITLRPTRATANSSSASTTSTLAVSRFYSQLPLPLVMLPYPPRRGVPRRSPTPLPRAAPTRIFPRNFPRTFPRNFSRNITRERTIPRKVPRR